MRVNVINSWLHTPSLPFAKRGTSDPVYILIGKLKSWKLRIRLEKRWTRVEAISECRKFVFTRCTKKQFITDYSSDCSSLNNKKTASRELSPDTGDIYHVYCIGMYVNESNEYYCRLYDDRRRTTWARNSSTRWSAGGTMNIVLHRKIMFEVIPAIYFHFY